MSPADWRALIEAYLDGRLSAPAFARRFLDAWKAQRDARAEPIPTAIEQLFFAVEAFPAFDLNAETANDDDMRNAAQRAVRDLGVEPAVAHTFDRTRAREDMRRFQVNLGGCAGIGCFIALAWVALCLLQVYFVVEWVDSALGAGALIAAVVGFVLAFVPVVGNVLAFLGWIEKDLPPLFGALIFFAAPAATFLSGWSRMRRFGR